MPPNVSPQEIAPKGSGWDFNICKLIGLSPAPPVSLCPQAGSAPTPTPACTLCCGCPWAVRVGARGGLGRAAQGALGQPLPVLWRGRFCLCTFASFVMKPNKNPTFSSLPPPLFSYPCSSPRDEIWVSQVHLVGTTRTHEYGHTDVHPSQSHPTSQLLGPVSRKGNSQPPQDPGADTSGVGELQQLDTAS